MMNRRQKRKLLRECKVLAVYVAVLGITVGVMKVTAGESDREASEIETVSVQAESIEFENNEKQDIEEAMVTIFNLPVEINEPEMEEPETDETESTYVEETEGLSEYECYLLAKIAMAEAEGEDLEGKALVIQVILNRVDSNFFPDTIEEVIFQKNQFSPLIDGRWDKVEPNEDCYEALEMVLNDEWDESHGALYFESESDSTWHRDNLKYLFQHGKHYFYTEKGL